MGQEAQDAEIRQNSAVLDQTRALLGSPLDQVVHRIQQEAANHRRKKETFANTIKKEIADLKELSVASVTQVYAPNGETEFVNKDLNANSYTKKNQLPSHLRR